jgi:hypothetical protein
VTVLLEAEIPRTLDAIVARFAGGASAGTRIEAWVFEDAPARAAAQAKLAAAGVDAHIRSAYKPLLHSVLDEHLCESATALAIVTPSHPSAAPNRFRLEAYPLAGMLGAVPVTFATGAGPLDHEITVSRRDGSVARTKVFAPNRVVTDHLGRAALAPCGWLRVWNGAALAEDAPVETEFEAAFRMTMAAVAAHPFGARTPYFETLEISVQTGGIERPLDYVDECISTREALHEDLYFSLLELFQSQAGRPAGDRRVQPGQIIPDIRPADGPTRVRITVQPPTVHRIVVAAPVDLATAPRPLTPDEIATALEDLGGTRFDGRSVQGRPVLATHFAGTSPGFVLSAGQHANETSGIIGALRAAPVLTGLAGIDFALLPLTNPDGHALHHRLRETHPRHMHHAARYTALGDDLESRTDEPLYEKATRLEAYRRTKALLHLNLHGYPSHEWTRPFTGYVPAGFESWAIPRGYFLIIRHAPGLAGAADWFLRALTARVIDVPGLRAYNERHLATYAAHAGAHTPLVHNAIPCMVSESPSPDVPLTLITEYPDETIYRDAFRLAHDAQTATVLAAIDLFLAPGGLAERIAEVTAPAPPSHPPHPAAPPRTG